MYNLYDLFFLSSSAALHHVSPKGNGSFHACQLTEQSLLFLDRQVIYNFISCRFIFNSLFNNRKKKLLMPWGQVGCIRRWQHGVQLLRDQLWPAGTSQEADGFFSPAGGTEGDGQPGPHHIGGGASLKTSTSETNAD